MILCTRPASTAPWTNAASLTNQFLTSDYKITCQNFRINCITVLAMTTSCYLFPCCHLCLFFFGFFHFLAHSLYLAIVCCHHSFSLPNNFPILFCGLSHRPDMKLPNFEFHVSKHRGFNSIWYHRWHWNIYYVKMRSTPGSPGTDGNTHTSLHVFSRTSTLFAS